MMAVVPFSQVELIRSKRQITQALSAGNWPEIKRTDRILIHKLQLASEDPQRNSAALLHQLGEIVSLYRHLLDRCRAEAEEIASVH